MQAVDDTIAALGSPVLIRMLGPSKDVAAVARWQHGPAIVEVRPSQSIRLAISLIDSRNAHHRSGGTLANRGSHSSVSVFSPAEGAAVEVCGQADVVQLFIDQSYVEETLDASFACPPMLDLRNNNIRAIVLRILIGSARPSPDDALKTEQDLQALILLIEGHAAALCDLNKISPKLFLGGLAPSSFRRVEAMMDAALNEASPLTLTQMADSAGLSVTHFVRAFHRYTGCTPHKYLVRRRMDRAISLLRAPRASVGDVADGSGFSTTAHFVAAFRKEVGVTPGALREALHS